MMKLEVGGFLTRLSYNLFKGILPNLPEFKGFRQSYRRSGIPLFYESYISLTLFASFVTFVSSCAVAASLHSLLLKLPSLRYITATLSFSWVASCIALTIFIFYPLYRRNQIAKKIDSNLVYTVGYMGVLAAGGISVERIFERVSEVERHPSIQRLAKRLITNIKVFGLDVVSSLKDTSLHSPSDTFSKILMGINNTVKTSVDLKSLLMFEVKRLLQVKRNQLKKNLGTLAYIGEMYITAMIVFPIVIIIMLTILSILGGGDFGLSPVVQLNLLVFMGIPVIAAVFLIILDAILSKEE